MSDESANADALKRRVEEAVGAIFEVEEEIGRGGMAVVYRALDKRLRRRVALKVLPPELAFRSDVRSRFMREAQMSAQLTHPNIVPIFSVEETAGIVYFAMGLVEGETLAKQLTRDPRPDVSFVRRVLREVCDGLAYAHAHGVVHRDIKPDNILIDRATGRAQVSDFGIARAAEGDLKLTATGVAVGTPAYMSPEQAMGEKEVDGRSDIYALGCVGWQMLAGELPFHSENTPGMLMKHISEQPRALHTMRSDVPANLCYAIERAMAKGRGDRWADATEFRDALDERVAAPSAAFNQGRAPAKLRAGWNARDNMGGANDSLPVARPDSSAANKPWRYNPLREDAARSDSGAHAIREWRQQREAFRERMRDALVENVRGRGLPIDHEPMSRRERRELRRMRREGGIDATPEDRIRSVQRQVVQGVMTIGFLAALNMFTSPRFPWFIFPALGIGIGIASRLGSLWVDGISFGKLFQRQPHGARSESAALEDGGRASRAAPRLPAPDLSGVSSDVLAGPFGATVREAAEAKVVIADVFAKLPESERLSLPDVNATAAALEERVRALASAIHQLDRDASPDALRRLEQRIADTRASGGDDAERARRVGLLERQQVTLRDLAERRSVVAQQLDSSSILLQTMKLDMLKLRSSDVESKIADSTMATQEARAVATDIERLVDAANEVRKL